MTQGSVDLCHLLKGGFTFRRPVIVLVMSPERWIVRILRRLGVVPRYRSFAAPIPRMQSFAMLQVVSRYAILASETVLSSTDLTKMQVGYIRKQVTVTMRYEKHIGIISFAIQQSMAITFSVTSLRCSGQKRSAGELAETCVFSSAGAARPPPPILRPTRIRIRIRTRTSWLWGDCQNSETPLPQIRRSHR